MSQLQEVKLLFFLIYFFWEGGGVGGGGLNITGFGLFFLRRGLTQIPIFSKNQNGILGCKRILSFLFSRYIYSLPNILGFKIQY